MLWREHHIVTPSREIGCPHSCLAGCHTSGPSFTACNGPEPCQCLSREHKGR